MKWFKKAKSKYDSENIKVLFSSQKSFLKPEIVDAINDGNVLPFRIDYVNTVKTKECMTDKQVNAINTEEALASHERISNVVSYIIEHFDQKTKRNSF